MFTQVLSRKDSFPGVLDCREQRGPLLMTQKPLVSAIVATYNRAHVVGEAIESILHQTYRNIEVIVVDDGSTDHTVRKLAQYGDSIKVVTQTNAGPGAARNKGIKESKGEIVAFLDSDDIWLPSFVERHVTLLESAGRSVPCSLSNSWLRFGTGECSTSFDVALFKVPHEENIWLNVGEVLATRFVMFTQMVAIRRTALESVGGFDENLWSLEDYDLALKLSIEGPWGLIREPLVVWRQGTSDSLSRRAYKDQIQLARNMILVRKRVLRQLNGSDRFVPMQRMLHRELQYAQLGLRAIEMGHGGAWFSGKIGSLLHLAERTRRFVFRRSPWFPQVEVNSITSTQYSSDLDSKGESSLRDLHVAR